MTKIINAIRSWIAWQFVGSWRPAIEEASDAFDDGTEALLNQLDEGDDR